VISDVMQSHQCHGRSIKRQGDRDEQSEIFSGSALLTIHGTIFEMVNVARMFALLPGGSTETGNK